MLGGMVGGDAALVGLVTDQAVEEKVVVVSHGGIVEDRGHLGALGVLDQQLSRFGVRIDSVCGIDHVSIMLSAKLFVSCASLSAEHVELTLCQQIQFLNKEALVLGPGEVKSLRGHEFRDTILLVVGIMLQLGDVMDATGLEG